MSQKTSLSWRCDRAQLALPIDTGTDGWHLGVDDALYIPLKSRCWIRLPAQSAPTAADRSNYIVLQRSPLLDLTVFNGAGQAIAKSSHDGTSHDVIEIGRRIMLPLAMLADGPLYVRVDSSNPLYQERIINKGFVALAKGVADQQRVLQITLFAATLLLTSAIFTASFGVVLRDLDFVIYAIYTFALSITLLAWDQVSLPLIGNSYGWVWQLSNPISTIMLCWLAIRFGKFHKHSLLISSLLILEMLVNFVLLLWAVLSLLGVSGIPMLFDRLAFENWQDLVTGALIIVASWRGWRRKEPDCLILMLTLLPSIITDFINRVWDPVLAPYLHSSEGLDLPLWLNNFIHFNSTLAWVALPLVFCFALARRAMLMHVTLIDERKRLEDRVLYRTQELHIANKELELLAKTDSLTGLANRRCMMDWIQREIEHASHAKKPLALCMIDVDHFKAVNDTHGHPTGDSAILAVARACNETIRKTDIVSRFGGEEFVILMPETDVTNAGLVTERLRAVVEALSFTSENNQTFSLTISIGVAFFDHGAAEEGISSLLNRADKALYRAKNSGRNQVVLS